MIRSELTEAEFRSLRYVDRNQVLTCTDAEGRVWTVRHWKWEHQKRGHITLVMGNPGRFNCQVQVNGHGLRHVTLAVPMGALLRTEQINRKNTETAEVNGKSNEIPSSLESGVSPPAGLHTGASARPAYVG